MSRKSPTLISWNVNGIRAVSGKGFLEWLDDCGADIVCIQESKAQEDQLDERIRKPDGYTSHWVSAEKKGYSGVATYYRMEPESITTLGKKEFDAEGRVQILTFADFTVINAYFPNSQAEGKRLDYKLRFCDAILRLCNKLRKEGKNVIVCGDFNIAHKPIDLTHPKPNEKNPGYLPEERAWMDKFIKKGYLDCFRMFNQDPEHYTWWSYRANARAKNVGWRIDYHTINPEFSDRVKSADILPDIMGSDHCPVRLQLK